MEHITATRPPAPSKKPFAIYVAASADPRESERVRRVITALKIAGFEVTCTWPEVIAKVGTANPHDAGEIVRRSWAAQDLLEVDAADALLFLVPPSSVPTRGAWLECGYAYAQNKHLLFAGDTKQSIFCSLGHEFETDGGAFAHLHKLRIDAGLAELRRNAPTTDEWPSLWDLEEPR